MGVESGHENSLPRFVNKLFDAASSFGVHASIVLSLAVKMPLTSWRIVWQVAKIDTPGNHNFIIVMYIEGNAT